MDDDMSAEVRVRPKQPDSQKAFNFGQFFVYTLERGYGADPDSIVKYQVTLDDD